MVSLEITSIFSPWNHDTIARTCFDDGIWKWIPFSYLVSFPFHIELSPVFQLNINNIFYCYIIKLRLYKRPVKDSSAIPKYFFLCNLVGYFKWYPRKLLLLFRTVHLTGKLPYLDNYKLMSLSMASFLGYFYYGCYLLFSCFWCNYSWLWRCFC